MLVSAETFEIWITRTRGPLERFFGRRGCARDLVDDLTQQTCANIWSSRETFRGECETTFRAWAFSVARTTWLKYWPRYAPERCVPITEEEPAQTGDPLAAAGRAEIEAALHAAIEQLPPQMRRCVLLFCQGRTVQEIAVLLRLQTGTVKAHLFQAREQLANRLGKLRDALTDL